MTTEMTLDRKKPVKSNGRKSIPSLHEAWRSQSHLSPASGRDDHKPPKIDTFSHVKWLSEKEGFLPIIFPSNSMLCLIISLSGSYSSSCLEPETLQVRIHVHTHLRGWSRAALCTVGQTTTTPAWLLAFTLWTQYSLLDCSIWLVYFGQTVFPSFCLLLVRKQPG